MLFVAVMLSVFAFILSMIAFLWAMGVKIDMLAFQRSTHQIQYVPIGDDDKEETDDTSMNKTLDDAEAEAYENVSDIHERSPKTRAAGPI